MRSDRWPSLFTLLVLAVDLALINGSFIATSVLKFSSLYPTGHFTPHYLKFQIFVNILVPLCLVLTGAYRDLPRAPVGHQALTSFKACVWSAAVILAVLFLDRGEAYSRQFMIFHLAQLTVLIPFSRVLVVRMNENAHLRGLGVRHVLVVGEREPLRDLALFLRMAPHLGYRVDAVLPIDFEPEPQQGPSEPLTIRDRVHLREVLQSGRIDRIFICDVSAERARWKVVIDLAEELEVETRLVRWPLLVPDFRTRIHDLLTVPVVPGHERIACTGAGAVAKRAFDLVGASVITALISPILAAIAIAIKLDSNGPVFYRQVRLTRDGRPFNILKFRSMNTLADEERARLAHANEATGPLFKIRRDPRITRVGAVLRRFSVDELPQVLNVIAGDLSLVGPRPPVPEESAAYEPWQRHRLDVTQGMTGLWQVSGRSRLSFEEMALLDLYYIENWSLLLDIEILMETLPTVLHGDGAF